jgi:hypothetical protein
VASPWFLSLTKTLGHVYPLSQFPLPSLFFAEIFAAEMHERVIKAMMARNLKFVVKKKKKRGSLQISNSSPSLP